MFNHSNHFLLLFLVLNFFLNGFLGAQENGFIEDCVNGTPVSYALITWDGNRKGVYSNEEGEYPVDNIKIGDTLRVQHLSYKNKITTITQPDDYRIALIPDSNYLEMITVTTSKAKTKYVRRKFKKKGIYSGGSKDFNRMIGRKWIPPVSGEVQVSEVKVYISNRGVPHTPFRLRILKNTKDTLEDLLLQDHIHHAKRGNRWTTVSIKEILLVNEPIWVVIEWLNTGESEFQYDFSFRENGEKRSRIGYGQSIGLTDQQEHDAVIMKSENSDWIYSWFKNPISRHQKPKIPMIKIGYKEFGDESKAENQ